MHAHRKTCPFIRPPRRDFERSPLDELSRGEDVAASVEDETANGKTDNRNGDSAKGRGVSWLGLSCN